MHKLVINIVLLVILGIMALSLYRVVSTRATADQNIAKLRSVYQQQKSENSQLSASYEYYSSDEYIQKISRDNLNLIPSGEFLVVLPSITTIPQDATKSPIKKNTNNLFVWIDLLIH